MSDDDRTLVDLLVEEAKATPEVVAVLERGRGALVSFLRDLNTTVAAVQDDPSDVAARVSRALLLRGTTETLVEQAFEQLAADEKEGRL